MIHLICNAHLDPVWLWEREEGIAEAISTFRIAADFCEKNDNFIFNHNEVILYKWVEEHDNALFKRIQGLVKAGKWHIMGGWYLQPDCNMPCGESIFRQIEVGREYFQKKFGVTPKTAINFDAFGHSRGLVQIMKKKGYDSYIFCRPFPDKENVDIVASGTPTLALPRETFDWIGFDGSKILSHRSYNSYLSLRGEAVNKVKGYINESPSQKTGAVLWGIGNHGGGPSKIDLDGLNQLIAENNEIIHSTPEKYFKEYISGNENTPSFDRDLAPFAVGCYTSQIQIKKMHRKLEDEYYLTEKMVTAAHMQKLMDYPKEELEGALEDLLFCEFHDILAGTSIREAETKSLQVLSHGLEIVERLKFKAFLLLTSHEKPYSKESNNIPIYAYNPHPYEVQSTYEVEFQLADQNWEDYFTNFIMRDKDGNKIPCQVEKERCNLTLDWRKKVSFFAKLTPFSSTSFILMPEKLDNKPEYDNYFDDQGNITIETAMMKIGINAKSGLIDHYCVNNINYLKHDSFKPIVMKDDEDSWAMYVDEFRNVIGSFECESLQVIEDGQVRTVVECILIYNKSQIIMNYYIPKNETAITVKLQVYWFEANKFLKLSIRPDIACGEVFAQNVFGNNRIVQDGKEKVMQKWCGVFGQDKTLAVINDSIYGMDYLEGELRLSLLRSPVYSSFKLGENRPIIQTDRHIERIDNGIREFEFIINGGEAKEIEATIDATAQVASQKPQIMSLFTTVGGKNILPLFSLSDKAIVITSLRKNSDNQISLRLFNTTNEDRKVILSGSYMEDVELNFNKFEVIEYNYFFH